MSEDLIETINGLPFNCQIEDEFVIKLLLLDFDIMLIVSVDVVKSIRNLPNGYSTYGGVCNEAGELFYSVKFFRLDEENITILDFEVIGLEDYLDYIDIKKTIKILRNGII